MKYIIIWDLGTEECEDWEEAEEILKKATKYWCNDPRYSGEPWEGLYKWCLEHKDFGDIAQVYTAKRIM